MDELFHVSPHKVEPAEPKTSPTLSENIVAVCTTYDVKIKTIIIFPVPATVIFTVTGNSKPTIMTAFRLH